MKGIKIEEGFLDLAKTDFNCPHCEKGYDDIDDKYLKKCNANTSNCTGVKCSCGKSFSMTYNMMGEAVSFI